MTNSAQLLTSVGNRASRKVFFALAVVCTLTSVGVPRTQAQTFSVLHYFTGGADGAGPDAGVTVGSSGVLYGTAQVGGTHSNGTVFKLSKVSSSWVLSPLYEFTGGSDGSNPFGGVVIGPSGALYGTTPIGGADNYGVVFELKPPSTVCRSVTCYWNETVLYNFIGTPDGEIPGYENLAFDQAGNIYGTTSDGGVYGYGTTFELTPSGGGYTESIIHSFNFDTGAYPLAGVLLDTAGNVYGTTPDGGTGFECEDNCGTVYQLTPSNGGWLENVLVNFDGANGETPSGNLIMDASGNLYGITYLGGQNEGGVVFKLAPSNGGWNYSVLFSFNIGTEQCDSYAGVIMDAAGNFFGACISNGAHLRGWVYELTNCSQTCTLVDLHDFNGFDGGGPWATPTLDANGNLYGTTVGGGTGNCEEGCGVVWEIAGAGAPQKR